MRHISVLASVALLTACASAPATTASRPEESIHMSADMGGGALTLTSNAAASVRSFPFPAERVWGALPAAITALAIPVSLVDTANMMIKNDGFKARRKLGDANLSKYFDCGTTQIGENADSYELYITLTTQVIKNSNGSTALSTLVEAMAKPVTFAQGYSRCASRGKLEAALADAVASQLQ